MYFHLTQSGREGSMKKFEVEGRTESEKEIDLWYTYGELQREGGRIKFSLKHSNTTMNAKLNMHTPFVS